MPHKLWCCRNNDSGGWEHAKEALGCSGWLPTSTRLQGRDGGGFCPSGDPVVPVLVPVLPVGVGAPAGADVESPEMWEAAGARREHRFLGKRIGEPHFGVYGIMSNFSFLCLLPYSARQPHLHMKDLPGASSPAVNPGAVYAGSISVGCSVPLPGR